MHSQEMSTAKYQTTDVSQTSNDNVHSGNEMEHASGSGLEHSPVVFGVLGSVLRIVMALGLCLILVICVRSFVGEFTTKIEGIRENQKRVAAQNKRVIFEAINNANTRHREMFQ